jgi:hypothetical protein
MRPRTNCASGWLYRKSLTLGTPHPSYVAAVIVINDMSKPDKILAVTTRPALFVVVGSAAITLDGIRPTAE